MSVEYRVQQNSQMNDEFSSLLRETHEYFKQNDHVSILGEGIKDILGDTTMFSNYVDKLTEGTNATEEETLRTLMENARINTFQEAVTGSIQPVASLTFPIIRKLWAKCGLKNVVPTETVKSNAFSVSFQRNFIIDELGEKHYLPEALKDPNNGIGEKKKLTVNALTLPLESHDLLADVGCSKSTGDSIDINFAIAEVTFKEDPAATPPRVAATVKVVRKLGLLDPNRKLYVEVELKDADGKVLATDIIFGHVDVVNGIIDATSLKGNVESLKIAGFVATDSHNRATNISFEIDKRDITIGTGEHFEASLPLEFLQDAMATYQIDGATEVIDTLSNVIAQKLDQEIHNFLLGVYDGTNAKYLGEFDLRPSAAFAGQPKDWREEIKTVIDHYATKIKSDAYAYQGYFALIGNPLDMMVIPNVNWTFNHTTDTQSGIEVDYNIGAISGQHRYTMVSSDLVAQGEIIMLFIPTTNKFMTVKYYPYTFNVVNNYLNTQRSAIPNVMMTKRHTMEEFLPLIGKITVKSNDGSLPR